MSKQHIKRDMLLNFLQQAHKQGANCTDLFMKGKLKRYWGGNRRRELTTKHNRTI